MVPGACITWPRQELAKAAKAAQASHRERCVKRIEVVEF
jgi:hypothetical protein